MASPSRAICSARSGLSSSVPTLMLALYAAELPKRWMRVAVAVILIIVVGVVIASVAGKGSTVAGIAAIADGLLIVLAPPAVVIGVLRNLRATGTVTVTVVAGVLCLYLLVGLFFAFTYTAVQNLGGVPFWASGDAATSSRSVVSSFVTMTTVGLRGLHRAHESRTHAVGDRGAARSDLPRHGRRCDRRPDGPTRSQARIHRRAQGVRAEDSRPRGCRLASYAGAVLALPVAAASLGLSNFFFLPRLRLAFVASAAAGRSNHAGVRAVRGGHANRWAAARPPGRACARIAGRTSSPGTWVTKTPPSA